MKLHVDSSGVTLRDSPGLWWLLALLFLTVGAAFVFIGLARSADAPQWQAALAMLMGLVGVATGVTFAWSSPGSIVRLDHATRELTLKQLGVFGQRRRSFRLDQIERVDVEHSHDDDGNTVARPVLTLRDRQSIVLSALWQHDVEAVRSATAALSAALKKDGLGG
jgi:hypothetical protein